MSGVTPRRGENEAERARTRRGPGLLTRLRRAIASRFDRAFSGWPVPFESAWELMEPWGLEVEDTGRELVVRAELPGYEASDFGVQFRGSLLTVRAEPREETGEKAPETVERRYGRLERTLTLPEGIEPAKVEACYHDGVLEVRVPKSPQFRPPRIVVKAERG